MGTLIPLASDNFTRANEAPLSNGGAWISPVNGGAQVNLTSNAAVASTTANESRAFWGALSWPDDQYSEVIIGAGFASTSGVDPSVRFTTSNAVNTGYRMIISPTTWSLGRNLAGTGVILATGSFTFSVGDAVRLEVEGAVLTGKKNGVAFMTPFVDTNITSGRSGFGLFDTVTATNAKVTSWVGGQIIVSSVAKHRGNFSTSAPVPGATKWGWS